MKTPRGLNYLREIIEKGAPLLALNYLPEIIGDPLLGNLLTLHGLLPIPAIFRRIGLGKLQRAMLRG